jgi:hypothetical protein
MNQQLIYVYCASAISPALNRLLASENLVSFEYENIQAIARYVSSADYSEDNMKKNFGDLNWIDVHTREHIRIINLVMKYATVAPFKFGTVFKSIESLAHFFTEYQELLLENLNYLEGKEEWGLKLFCNNQVFTEFIKQNCNDFKIIEQQINESKPGKAFILKRKSTEILKEETHKQLKIWGQFCFDQIEKLCCKTRINPLLPNELTERSDDMVLNIACLIEKMQVQVLLRKIDSFKDDFQKAGLICDATGPWPPFSFTTTMQDYAK